jgi:hypothetical protein
MTPLGVKTCGESEFGMLEAKKRFPDPEKACVIELKLLPMNSIQVVSTHIYFGHSAKKNSKKKSENKFSRAVSLSLP